MGVPFVNRNEICITKPNGIVMNWYSFDDEYYTIMKYQWGLWKGPAFMHRSSSYATRLNCFCLGLRSTHLRFDRSSSIRKIPIFSMKNKQQLRIWSIFKNFMDTTSFGIIGEVNTSKFSYTFVRYFMSEMAVELTLQNCTYCPVAVIYIELQFSYFVIDKWILPVTQATRS